MGRVEAYEILKSKCLANKDLNMEKIEEAYILATEAHTGQYRKSGEEYIIHPIEVAQILVDLRMDTDTIVAGLLHDVVEDTLITLADIEYVFGKDVALLVDGVTKLRNLPKKQGKQIENIRKMVVAMSLDIRVVIIKLADRLHNMRTIEFQSQEKQIEKSKECIDIFAPIAHRIGMAKIKSELEDISFSYLNKEAYQEIKMLVNEKKEERENFTNNIVKILSTELDKYKIKAKVTGRPKHLYSIYRKINEKNKKFAELMDLTAIRVIVDKEEECYMVLGIVHSIFVPVSGRFKDYIAVPKSNGYQSIHTTVECENKQKVEIQIRTHEMHEIAEEGVAAHWKYKEKKSKDKNEKYYQVVKKMIDTSIDKENGGTFVQSVTDVVLNETIFVFTPKGDVIELANNSTALDFAFQVHTQIGYRTIGAKVNDKIVPLDSILVNGDKVEIMTSKATKGPGKDWINMVNNHSSRLKIRKWFKDKEFEEKAKIGEELLEQEFQKIGLKFKELEDDERVYLYMKKYNLSNIQSLFYKFAVDDLKIETFIQKFKPLVEQSEKELIEEEQNKGSKLATKHSSSDKLGIKITGADNTLFHFAKCCDPLPGDIIQGYVTRGRGIVIHKNTCQNIKNLVEKEPEREVEVYWDEALLKTASCKYQYSFTIKSLDRDGLIFDIIRILNEHKMELLSVNTTLKKEHGQVYGMVSLRIMIKNKEDFERLRKNLLSMKDVIDII